MVLDRHVFHLLVPLEPGTNELVPADDLGSEERAVALAKYDDTPERRRLRDTTIPLIERKWTEVVFLLPVHPHAIWSTWRAITGRERPSMKFWAIPVAALPAGTVVLDRRTSAVGNPIDPAEVTRLDTSTFESMTRTTNRNVLWLEELAAKGWSEAWFHGIPHVLAPGHVSLETATTVDWAQTPPR